MGRELDAHTCTAGEVDWDSMMPHDPMPLHDFSNEMHGSFRAANYRAVDQVLRPMQRVAHDASILRLDDDDVLYPADAAATAVNRGGGDKEEDDDDNMSKMGEIKWIQMQRIRFLSSELIKRQSLIFERIQMLQDLMENVVGGSRDHVPSNCGANKNLGVDAVDISMLKSRIDELVEQAHILKGDTERLQQIKNMSYPHVIDAQLPVSLSNALDAVLKDHADHQNKLTD